jgi:hypothetical protein
MYLLGCTGGRSGEFVDNEKKPLEDDSLEEIFGPKAQKTMTSRTRTRSPNYSRTCCLRQVENAAQALCYEDLLLAAVRHPEIGRDVLVMVIKLVHHLKDEDRKPRP